MLNNSKIKINNEIVRNCVDIVNSEQFRIIHNERGEFFSSYDVCAKSKNASGLVPLFTVTQGHNRFVHADYYVLSNKNVKFYSNIEYGEGIDFSELYILYAACQNVFIKQQEDNFLKKYKSMLNYTQHIKEDYVKSRTQK